MDLYASLDQATQELTAPEALFELTRNKIGGQDLLCFKKTPPDLRTVWLGSKLFSSRDYLVYNDERWTYAEAHAQVASMANWLVSVGVEPGDRVAIAMRNYPEWMLSYWAILSVGAAAVGMNSWWVEGEMSYALADSKPKVLLCDQERFTTFLKLKQDFPDMTVAIARARGEMPMWTAPWIDLLGIGGDLPDVQIDPDSDACIFYTSGTTGVPKGAQLTHRGCVTNIMNILFSGACGIRVQELQGMEVVPMDQLPPVASLVTTPLFHVTANNCGAQVVTMQGGKMTLMYRWDPEIALELIEKEEISNVSGVPMMARELIAHPNFAKTNTSSLRMLGGGGAALQPDLVTKINAATEAVVPNTGYGMTEVCGIITAVSGALFIDKPESCGRAVPTLETRIVDDSGQDLPTGTIGELWVKGSPVIAGYLNLPEATAETITDGWLHTGDLGYLDEEDFIYIVDRKKDMILRGGENIYCAEVDNAIFSLEEVAECSSFGVIDDRLGEEVGVAIVLKENASLNADAIRAHCKNKMAPFKVPRYIWFQDEPLPRNASGKFVKRELRDSLAVETAS